MIMNIDTLLITIINHNFNEISTDIPPRDVKILHSLSRAVLNNDFITENQGRLLIKIFHENIAIFNKIEPNISTFLESPMWSRSFRPVDKTKKVYIADRNSYPKLIIEFAFSTYIRKIISELVSKEMSGFAESPGRLYVVDLTEQNVVNLVKHLKPLDFEFDSKVIQYYDTIASWSEDSVRNKYLINTIDRPEFQSSISIDLGINTPLNKNLIADRSIRYQYFTEKHVDNDTLTSKIANRLHPATWINKEEFTLEQVISSLIELKRLPLMVVFDANNPKKYYSELKTLIKALNDNGIDQNIGIYFRIKNEDTKSEFNQLISDLGLNCHLDDTTKVVGVQNGKIPKFLLQTDWKPLSVLAIGHTLRNNKTAVYANRCDLIISYSDQPPLLEKSWTWAQN